MVGNADKPWLRWGDEPAGETEIELLGPTPEEARNGWTAESLTAHRTLMMKAERPFLERSLLPRPKPQRTNTKYAKLRWHR